MTTVEPKIYCKACVEKRRHTDVDWQNHPDKGHGFVKEQGWSKEGLEEKTS